MKKQSKKGFTLIEMLVVIAIIAVLVAIIIPTVTSATTKAEAATDAANLRSIMGMANSRLATESTPVADVVASIPSASCKSFPGAKAYIYYVNPGFIIGHYEIDGNVYTINSFAAAAESGTPPVADTLPAGGISYPVGGTTE